MPPTIPTEIIAALRDLSERWHASDASERASFQTWRWLRPDYQIPRFAPKPVAAKFDLPDSPAEIVVEGKRPWPATAVDQLAAIGTLLGQRSCSVDDVMAAFSGARRELVARHLETLAMMGEVVVDSDGRFAASRKTA